MSNTINHLEHNFAEIRNSFSILSFLIKDKEDSYSKEELKAVRNEINRLNKNLDLIKNLFELKKV